MSATQIYILYTGNKHFLGVHRGKTGAIGKACEFLGCTISYDKWDELEKDLELEDGSCVMFGTDDRVIIRKDLLHD